MSTLIQGIPSFKDGVWLTKEAYNLNTIPEGFTEFYESQNNNNNTGLQAKFLRKDQTVYVLVAGTNDDWQDKAYNWPTLGKSQFKALDPVLREVILKAQAKECNVVIVGDSGGGLVAQHASLKYGIDAFCTNTTSVGTFDARMDIASRDKDFYYNQDGKMITVINDGEALSTSLGYPHYDENLFTDLGYPPSNSEVFVIPSKAGALYQYNVSQLGQDPKMAAITTFKQGVAAHKDRQYMIDYLDQGQTYKVYFDKDGKSSGINYYTYVGGYPELLPPGSYSYDPIIMRTTEPNSGADILHGYYGRNMLKGDFAAVLSVPVDQVVWERGGSFLVDLTNYPNANVDGAIDWFEKTRSLNSNLLPLTQQFAVGGHLESGQVSGPGTGTSDSILAWLGNKEKFIRISNGEYVIRANAVQKWGTNFLDSINNGLIPQEFQNVAGRYATGGSISEDSVIKPQGNLGEAFRNAALTFIQSIQNYAQELIKQMMSGLGLDMTIAKSSSAGSLSNATTFPNVRLKQDATGSILTAPQLADYNNELAKTPSLLERIHEASKKTFEAGLSNFLTEGIMKSKNLGEAFHSLAISVLQSIQKIYAEAVTKNIMSMLGLGAKTPETPSSTTSVLGTTDSSGFYYDPNFGFKFAEGGHIQGSGTGTSDSILSWLSNGEYVIKASSVQKYGTNFLHTLNKGFVPNNLMPRFATGGLVGASLEGATAIASSMQSGDVTVPLKVVNVTDPNEVGRYLKTRSGERIMVNFMKNNAGTMRQILNVKG